MLHVECVGPLLPLVARCSFLGPPLLESRFDDARFRTRRTRLSTLVHRTTALEELLDLLLAIDLLEVAI